MNERDVLEVLACDVEARPRGAASLADLVPAVRGVRRESGALVIEFAAEAAPAVAEFAAAARLCCPEIGWELREALALRITASPTRLDLLQQLFGTSNEERETRK